MGIMWIYRLKGDHDQAMDLFQSARDRFLKMKAKEKVALCDCKIATIFAAREEYVQAIELWERAKQEFLRSGMKSDSDLKRRTQWNCLINRRVSGMHIMFRIVSSICSFARIAERWPLTEPPHILRRRVPFQGWCEAIRWLPA